MQIEVKKTYDIKYKETTVTVCREAVRVTLHLEASKRILKLIFQHTVSPDPEFQTMIRGLIKTELIKEWPQVVRTSGVVHWPQRSLAQATRQDYIWAHTTGRAIFIDVWLATPLTNAGLTDQELGDILWQ